MSKEVSDDLLKTLKEQTKLGRIDILEMTHRANSGHPGGSLSAIEILSVLFFHEMNFDPKKPDLPNRDRFVLSKGHVTPGYYSTLARAGFFSSGELKNFRQKESILQGHPNTAVPGVEVATGSLGQGLSVGIGIALCATLDKLDYRTYVLMGDGELQEGQCWEAAMSAGVRGMDNIVAIIDYNGLAQDSAVSDLKDLEPLDKKFEAFGWHVIKIDGHDIPQIIGALDEAKSTKGKPTVIIAKTVKGKGVSFMENELGWHGVAPNEEQLKAALDEVNNG